MPPITFNRRQVVAIAATPLINTAARAAKLAPQFQQKLSRGINFHHVLNWPALRSDTSEPTYSWPPFADDKYKLRVEDLSLVRSLGFDFVRLTVDPGLWIAEGARHEDELERHYFATLETLLAADLNVVFDLAAVDNHPDFTPMQLVSRENPQHFATYSAVVVRAAQLLSRAPHDRVALELFNEPPIDGDAGEKDWSTMQQRLHAYARDAAPDLALILTAARWGDGAALTRLDASPYAASNVIYTFHYYAPYLFTHQGTKTGAISYVSGVDWPITMEQMARAESAAEQAASADKRLGGEARARVQGQIQHAFSSQMAKPHDESAVARDFDAISNWAQANRIAPQRVLLGEFGCVLAARGRPTGEARLQWLSTVRRAAEARSFGWAYWAFKGYGGMELVDQKGALHFDLLGPLGLNAPG